MSSWKTTFHSVLLSVLIIAICLQFGCSSNKGDTELTKMSRPVTVFRLEESDPSRMDRLTGSVASWKTEDLGFEVPGRVEFVIEPERDIEGEIFRVVEGDEDTKKRVPVSKGQVLAKLDKTRYELTVASVIRQKETATEHKNAAEIEYKSVIPAQKAAAEADLKYREEEVKRNSQLVKTRAISQAEFDKVIADRDAASAAVKQIEATRNAKQAEVLSLQAKIDELEETLLQAKRDVADCELTSPFRGQVAHVHVIPGGVVKAGQPVVTAQMMDPIKVELEVSAATSRRLNYRDVVNVFVPKDNEVVWDAGKIDDATESSQQRAFVYTIDPVADSVTRTFTVTLLVQNQKVQSKPPPELGDQVVRARDVWEFHEAPFLKEGVFFVETNAIHDKEGEPYVWKVENWEQVVKKETAVLNVTKVKVIPGEMNIDWLGLWTFQEVTLPDGADFDQQTDLVAGELDTTGPITGDKILLDRQQWRLRPGDIVDVDLNGARQETGFYVPMDSIHVTGGSSYVFAVTDDKVQRIEVTVTEGPNTLKRIEGVGTQLTAGTRLISNGVHYITDGEAVNVVEEMQVQP